MRSEAEKKLEMNEPKLSLHSLPGKPAGPPGMHTPPLQPAASVPFLWEEAPGKPRQVAEELKPKSARSLELPPRLFNETKITSLPSPTTVLDGPYVVRCRTLSSSLSFRIPRSAAKKETIERGSGGGWGYFGSRRWGSFRKNYKEIDGGVFDLSPAAGADGGEGGTTVKITRVRRKGSLSSLSRPRSHLFVSQNKHDFRGQLIFFCFLSQCSATASALASSDFNSFTFRHRSFIYLTCCRSHYFFSTKIGSNFILLQ